MKSNEQLHHKLITVPEGKDASSPVAERHDIVLLFDCAKSNPNGDPDTGNMPRVQPDSLKGLVTDVCLKRKIRNFFSQCHPDGTLLKSDPLSNSQAPDGYRILIHENAVIQQLMEAPDIEKEARRIFSEELKQDPNSWDVKKKKSKAKKSEAEPSETEEAEQASPSDDLKKRAIQLSLMQTFFDVRAFGGVLSTEGPLKGSFYGQIRGPIQITFAESLDKVLPLDATITRCAVASLKEQGPTAGGEDEGANRTMGRKHGIDYGLYRCHIHFSPAFAAKTGFSYYDLDNFIFALQHMFDDDHAAGRHLRLMGLVDFQHVSSLGNAPAHKLFELVQVQGITEKKDEKEVFVSSKSEFPRSLDDYSGSAPEGPIYRQKDGSLTHKQGDATVSTVTARRIVWDIKSAAL